MVIIDSLHMCFKFHISKSYNRCGELGNGNGGVRHSLEPHPVDLAGLCGGAVRRIDLLGSGPCANHTLLVSSGRLPWPMTRVLLAGVLRGDPSRCMLARLPHDGNLSCSLLNNILHRVAAV